jgi:YesN/AraC family two-component response regulator
MSGYHNVSSFTDPLLAYQHIQENPNKYSLVITDDKMPDMSGLFLSTKLLEINPKLNVILLSDHFHDDDLKYIINLIFLKSVYQYTN